MTDAEAAAAFIAAVAAGSSIGAGSGVGPKAKPAFAAAILGTDIGERLAPLMREAAETECIGHSKLYGIDLMVARNGGIQLIHCVDHDAPPSGETDVVTTDLGVLDGPRVHIPGAKLCTAAKKLFAPVYA